MSKKFCLFFVFLYAALILFFSVLLFAMPKSDFSPTENRMLADFPSFSAYSFFDGSYMEKFSDFCSDRFPFRSSLLAIDAATELALGKLESDTVMTGRDGNLIKRLEYSDLSQLKANIEAIKNLRKFAERHGADSLFFCAPRSVDVLADFCPFSFLGERYGEVWKEIGEAATVTDELKRRANAGEYVFYKTDHHWTSLGAYCAYAALGKELGFEPFPLSDFTPKKLSDCFYGTTYSSALIPGAVPDELFALRYQGDSQITVTDPSTGKKSGIYDFTALEGSSKYNFFLGGNKARLRVEGKEKAELVIIKDSFANSVIPFLARHYNIEIIDPRYLREPLGSLLEKLYSDGKSPTLLILFCIDTLTEKIGL